MIDGEQPNLNHPEGGARLAEQSQCVTNDASLGQGSDKLETFSLSTCHQGDNGDSVKNVNKGAIFAPLDEYFNLPSRGLTESNLRVWMAEIVLAVAHLHSNDIICRLVAMDVEKTIVIFSHVGVA